MIPKNYPVILEAFDERFIVNNENELHDICNTIVKSRSKINKHVRPETVESYLSSIGVSEEEYQIERRKNRFLMSLDELEEIALYNKHVNARIKNVNNIINGIAPKENAFKVMYNSRIIKLHSISTAEELKSA